MYGPYADLHVHSFHSDGSMSPEEILSEAKANGVGVLAIADHCVTGGSRELMRLCAGSGISHIPAVELCTLDRGKDVHILAYGFDMEDAAFTGFVRHIRFMLDEVSKKLIEIMQSDYPRLSLREFIEYTYDKRLGGWDALHYFMEKGLTSSLKDGLEFYPRYGMTYDKYGYPYIAATAYRINKAGGYAILAHPGEIIEAGDIDFFHSEVKRLISYGLDGIECYYPSHSEAVTQACLEICRENNLMVTSGSDCHGTFGRYGETKVGVMKTTLDMLELGDLI